MTVTAIQILQRAGHNLWHLATLRPETIGAAQFARLRHMIARRLEAHHPEGAELRIRTACAHYTARRIQAART